MKFPRRALSRLASALRPNRPKRRARRPVVGYEMLESRAMLAGPEPHTGNPTYNPASFHIHARLNMFVNTQLVTIPANVGRTVDAANDTEGFTSFVHTHAADNLIHMHNFNGLVPDHFLTLGDFFTTWRTVAGLAGNNPNAVLNSTRLLNNVVDASHTLKMFVNGIETQQFENYKIFDGDSISLVYSSNPVVTLNTNLGPIPVELFREPTSNAALLRAGQTGPVNTSGTVANFLQYVNSGEFNNMFFHRSDLGATSATSDDFVLQGGRFQTTDGTSVADKVAGVDKAATITNEPGLSNVVGTVAMARRSGAVNSATSEFFINYNDNQFLDTVDQGFTVFGQVLDTTVLNSIRRLSTSAFSTNVFEATLSGSAEVPSVTTSAEGGADLTFRPTNNTFDLNVFVEGITKANLTGSGIQLGASGANGATIFDLGDGSQWTQEANGLRRTITNGAFPAANVSAFLSGGTYLNVKTTANPNGEIRGQLFRGSVSNAPVTASNKLVFVQSVGGQGTIRGVSFNDANGNGTQDQGEAGLANSTIYADANNNNVKDADEVSTLSATDGSYSLTLDAGAHTIRQVPATPFRQTTPAAQRSATVTIANVTTGVDFGNQAVATPGAPVLLLAADSGIAGDNITSFDNRSASRALQLSIGGVTPGATVRVFADNVQIGQTVANASTVTVTTDGSRTLANGVRRFTVVQIVDSSQSASSAPLDVTIDTQVQFSSTAPTTATFGTQLLYDAQSAEEGAAGFVYALGNNIPSGVTLNTANGQLRWTPTASQIGNHTIELFATDAAGNQTSQVINLTVGGTPDAQFRVVVTNTNGQDLTSLNVGQQFLVTVFAKDPRATPAGVFAGYMDLVYDSTKVQVLGNINHQPTFNPQNDFFSVAESGTIQTSVNLANAVTSGAIDAETARFFTGTTVGVLNEVGASTSTPTSRTNGNEFPLYSVLMTATGSGTVQFVAEKPDVLPDSQILLFSPTTPVDPARIQFGRDQLTVNSSVGANPDTRGIDEDSGATLLQVLQNDEALPGSSGQFTISKISAVTSTPNGPITTFGTVEITADQKDIRYTPALNYFGQISFSYTVTDGASSSTAQVNVIVFGVNDAPTGVNDSLSVSEDASGVLLDVLNNDTVAPDEAGEKNDLRVSALSSTTTTAGGTVTINPTRTGVLYTAPANFSGTDTFTYTLVDRSTGTGGLTSTATATINVQGVNDPPVAVNDAFTVTEDSAAADFDVLANDTTAPDVGETLSIINPVTPSAGGTATISAGKIRYTPKANFAGLETITYTISDGNGGTATGTVRMTVTNTNDPPTAANDTSSGVKNSVQTINVLANDSFSPDTNEVLTITSKTATSSGGTVQIAADGKTLTYTPPNATFTGTDTFTYTISDGNGGTATATVTVTVLDFTPRAIMGVVVNDDPDKAIGGLTVTLTGKDTFGADVQKSAVTAGDGSYEFSTLAPGNYTIARSNPRFLLAGTTKLTVLSAANDGNSESNNFQQPGRRAEFMDLRDFLGSTPRKSIIASVAPGGSQEWYYFDGGWDGYRSASVGITADLKTVTLSATDASGTPHTTSIDATNPKKVEILGREGANTLLRIRGSAASLGFDTTSSARIANTELTSSDQSSDGHDDTDGHDQTGEGEAPPTSSGLIAEGEDSHSGHVHDDSHDHAGDEIVTNSTPTTAGIPGAFDGLAFTVSTDDVAASHSSSEASGTVGGDANESNPVDDVFTQFASQPEVSNSAMEELLAEHHHDEEEFSSAVDSVLDELYAGAV